MKLVAQAMLSSGINDMTSYRVALGFLLLVTPFISVATDSDVRDRLKSLKIIQQVDFEEQVHNAFFMEPQKSRGTLSFDPQTQVLIKSIHEPDQITLTASTQQVTIEQSGARRSIDIAANSVIVQVLEIFRSLLSVDYEALQTLFSIDLDVSSEMLWSLVLEPRNGPLRDHIESITVIAETDSIKTVETVFTNGDWQKLNILAPTPAGSHPVRGDGVD